MTALPRPARDWSSTVTSRVSAAIWSCRPVCARCAATMAAMMPPEQVPVTAITGTCSGGIIAAMVAAHLAHTGRQDQIAALTLLVTVLDQSRAGLGSAVIDERNARLAAAASAARGYLDGRSLAEVFAWLRPNDLIW